MKIFTFWKYLLTKNLEFLKSISHFLITIEHLLPYRTDLLILFGQFISERISLGKQHD